MERFYSMLGENDFTKLKILLTLLLKIISCRDTIWEWKNSCWLVFRWVFKTIFESATYKMKLLNYFEYRPLGDNSYQQTRSLPTQVPFHWFEYIKKITIYSTLGRISFFFKDRLYHIKNTFWILGQIQFIWL